MTNYKDYRIIDGKLKQVIINGNGTIINRNPNKEELKSSLLWDFKYNGTNTCNVCNTKFELSTGHPCRGDKYGKFPGIWLCYNCFSKDYHKYNPTSHSNLKKSMRDHRIDNLSPNSTDAIGENAQKLTCKWLGTKDLNIENDNYNYPIDHSAIPNGMLTTINDKLVDLSGKIPQTKCATYNSYDKRWSQNFKCELNQIANGFKFDILVLYCKSKDGKIIERIYIFLVEEIIKRSSIGIYKNPTDRWSNPITPWYEKYRITDEITINQVNDIWKEIIGDIFKNHR